MDGVHKTICAFQVVGLQFGCQLRGDPGPALSRGQHAGRRQIVKGKSHHGVRVKGQRRWQRRIADCAGPHLLRDQPRAILSAVVNRHITSTRVLRLSRRANRKQLLVAPGVVTPIARDLNPLRIERQIAVIRARDRLKELANRCCPVHAVSAWIEKVGIRCVFGCRRVNPLVVEVASPILPQGSKDISGFGLLSFRGRRMRSLGCCCNRSKRAHSNQNSRDQQPMPHRVPPVDFTDSVASAIPLAICDGPLALPVQ